MGWGPPPPLALYRCGKRARRLAKPVRGEASVHSLTVVGNNIEAMGNGNSALGQARRAKNDEFYTQYPDIEKEMNAYLEYDSDVFRDKVVFLPCDDPEWSNFTKYFSQNFERLGLRKLISTSYAPNSKPKLIDSQPTLFEIESPLFDESKSAMNGKIFTLSRDLNGDRRVNVDDLEWKYLEGDGDFRSDEIRELRDESDFIITNPPFSLFREFLAWIMESNKRFTVIGNMNAIPYKEVFPLIKANKTWLGATGNGSDMVFRVPEGHSVSESDKAKAERLGYVGNYTRLGNSCWYTNIEHGRRHQPLTLMSMADNLKYSRHKEIKLRGYQRYENYDAIEVPFTDAIPNDYAGLMGVPISFLDKYSPEQFEIVGTSANGLVDDAYKITPGLTQKFVDDYYRAGGTGAYKAGNPTAGIYQDGVARMVYQRIFIRHREALR